MTSCSAYSASQRLRTAFAVPQLREGGLQRFDRSLVAVDHGGVDIEGCGLHRSWAEATGLSRGGSRTEEKFGIGLGPTAAPMRRARSRCLPAITAGPRHGNRTRRRVPSAPQPKSGPAAGSALGPGRIDRDPPPARRLHCQQAFRHIGGAKTAPVVFSLISRSTTAAVPVWRNASISLAIPAWLVISPVSSSTSSSESTDPPFLPEGLAARS